MGFGEVIMTIAAFRVAETLCYVASDRWGDLTMADTMEWIRKRRRLKRTCPSCRREACDD